MKLNIIGENITVTPAIEKYLHEKMQRALKTVQPDTIDVRIGKENHLFFVKVNTLYLKNTISIKEEQTDLYFAIDTITKKTNRSLKKIKTKKELPQEL